MQQIDESGDQQSKPRLVTAAREQEIAAIIKRLWRDATLRALGLLPLRARRTHDDLREHEHHADEEETAGGPKWHREE